MMDSGFKRPGNGHSVLIVDDDIDLNKTVNKILRKSSVYNIRSAFSPEEALDTIRKKSPSLVLLDISMPRMNGMEVLKIIKEIDNGIPVIMMSAYYDTDLAEQSFNLGACDYVSKPIDFEYLVKVMTLKLG